MRHHSERIPGKNFRPLAGRPLFEYILETLHLVPELAEIVVDTDSPVIEAGVRATFPQVVLIERPEALRGDRVSMNEVILNDVQQIEAPTYLQTHSTTPFLRAETISRAIATFFEAQPQHDSLFSVTPLHRRLWDAQGRAINHDPQELIRTQDLPPVYEENSCLYIFSRERFLELGNRIGNKPKPFEVHPLEAWDIDEPFDFEVAECLIGRPESAGKTG